MSVDDAPEVAALIDALGTSLLVDSPFPAGEPAFSIDLVRADGTITRRFVDVAIERLSPRIELPPAWRSMLDLAASVPAG
jgi:hypothetical protein